MQRPGSRALLVCWENSHEEREKVRAEEGQEQVLQRKVGQSEE